MTSETSDVKRILVVELWNIGDVVLLLPFLQQLRTIFPNASVTLVARSYARDLLGPTGLVDEFIETDLAWQHDRVAWNPAAYPWLRLARLINELRGRKFDVAFQSRGHTREYLLLWLSGAKRRVGVSRRGWDRLLTDRVSVDSFGMQKKDLWLALLGPFGGARNLPPPKLEPSKAARARASQFLGARGVSTEDLLIAIHPGASVASKRWPLQRFSEVAERLVDRSGTRVVIFVDPSGYGSELEGDDGRIIARVDLPDMVALLDSCDLLVCNDSGPMHIAAALGVPCVAVFSAGIDQIFAPLGEGHRLIAPALEPSSEQGGPKESRLPPRYDVTQVPVGPVIEAIELLVG